MPIVTLLFSVTAQMATDNPAFVLDERGALSNGGDRQQHVSTVASKDTVNDEVTQQMLCGYGR